MEAFELLKEKMSPILKAHGFIISEEKNYARGSWVDFSSNSVQIRLGYDAYAREKTIWIGLIGGTIYEISYWMSMGYFGDDFKLDCSTEDEYTNEIVSFFENSGKNLLLGDKQTFKSLDDFVKLESKKYNERFSKRKLD